jgi:hypothetical protein
VNRAWHTFFDELTRWADAGRQVDFWWRDDDAAQPQSALTRLLALSASTRVPLGLAVIPQRMQDGLLADAPATVAVLQHGGDHLNRAAADQKACEFPQSESIDDASERICAGSRRLKELAGTRTLPVFVPPWNRISAKLSERLPQLGFRALSMFNARSRPEFVPGLRQVNTHVDLIAWRHGQAFVGEEQAIAQALAHLSGKRTGQYDANEPTGWLTHHERHDEPLWRFLSQLFDQTARLAHVRWLDPAKMFMDKTESHMTHTRSPATRNAASRISVNRNHRENS